MKIFTFTSLLLCSSFVSTAQTTDLSQLIRESDIPDQTKELMLNWVTPEMTNDEFQSVTDIRPFLELRHKHVAGAPKDGCYYGLGDPRNSFVPGGLNQTECAECERNGGKIKKNESYVWGLTEGNGQMYFGVNTNYLCIAMADMTQGGLTATLPAYENQCWACEYDKSPHHDDYGVMWGDWRTPRIYNYNPQTGKQLDVTPADDPNMQKVYGLRAAGSLGNVSFIAGPNKGNSGITFIAFDNVNNRLLGTKTFDKVPGFDDFIPFNIRRSIVINGILYFGVEYKDKATGKSNGALMRWYGDEENPFDFKVVGWTPKGANEFAVLKNKLYIGTWPLSVCRSEEIPEDGFQPKTVKPTDADRWKTVFDYTTYEPDRRLSYITYCGGMTVFKDQIYFGAIHMTWGNHFIIPGLYGINPEEDPEGFINAFFGMYRSSALFRLSIEEDPAKEGENWGTVSSSKTKDGCKIEMLYGEEKLPAYNDATKKWDIKQTNWTPVFGKSGFNNRFINYVWSANVYDDKLFLGTMDFSNLIVPQIESLIANFGTPLPPAMLTILNAIMKTVNRSGYEFVYFDKPEEKAKILNRDGYGNEAAYGIRNIINIGDKMYLGTANPLNLHEDGGWEIVEVSKEKPFCEPTIKWNPAPLTFGDYINENQLNAVAEADGATVPGTYKYTYCWDNIPTEELVRPGSVELRVEFTPEDAQTYSTIKSKQVVKVGKAPLDVTAPDVEIEEGQSFPSEEYALLYDGFIADHDASSLQSLPVWKTNMQEGAPTGEYEINVSGGESDLYELAYHHGKLIVRLANALDETASKELRVYPVPVKDRIYFEGEAQIEKLVVTRLDGTQVFSVDYPGESADLSTLNPSPYLMMIHTDKGVITRKIFVAE